MTSTLEIFKDRCREMYRKSLINKTFPDGAVIWRDCGRPCINPKCENKIGIYRGTIVSGKIPRTRQVGYCPRCRKIRDIKEP